MRKSDPSRMLILSVPKLTHKTRTEERTYARSSVLNCMAGAEGLEPATAGFGNQCSAN